MSNGERDRYYICEDYTIANEYFWDYFDVNRDG